MKVVLVGFLGLVAFFVLRSALNDWFRDRVVASATGKGASCLSLAGSTTSEQDGHTYIIGSIRNSCDHKISSATVVFKLDRPSGVTENLPQAIAYAYSRDVKPGETRSFKTAMPISSKATYHFDGITAF